MAAIGGRSVEKDLALRPMCVEKSRAVIPSLPDPLVILMARTQNLILMLRQLWREQDRGRWIWHPTEEYNPVVCMATSSQSSRYGRRWRDGEMGRRQGWDRP